GYYHEVIEERDGKYSYRYTMTKVENNSAYYENIGALAEKDLTPIAFNLNKTGGSTIESINATYSKAKPNPFFNIEVKGAKVASLKRHVSPQTILDVFFPIYLKQNWNKIKPGYKASISTFTEDAEKDEFRPRTVSFEVKEFNSELKC